MQIVIDILCELKIRHKNVDFETFLIIILLLCSFEQMSVDCGGVAEWSKAAVLKTVDAQVSVGSNPTSSAIFFCGEVSERPKELAC